MPESIVVLAGAGVAASVGLPALHGPSASILEDEHYSKVLSSKEYGNYLPDFWEFARGQAEQAWALKPSAVHEVVKDRGWKVITQNIGGHHVRAGSEGVIAVYGTLFRKRCLRCQEEEGFTLEDYRKLEPGQVPACGKCKKERTRPDICLPHESLRHKKVAQTYLANATAVVYLGVGEHSGPTTSWYQRVPESVLVSSKGTWGSFSKYVELSPHEWALSGGAR